MIHNSMCPSRGVAVFCAIVLFLLIVQCQSVQSRKTFKREKLIDKPPSKIKWFSKGCPNVNDLLNRRDRISKQLNKLVADLTAKEKMESKDERWSIDLKIRLYSLVMREINQTEQFIYSALNSFMTVLKGDINDIEQLKEESVGRIKALQHAIRREEVELREVSKLEEDFWANEEASRGAENANKTKSVMKKMFAEMLSELRSVASDIGIEQNSILHGDAWVNGVQKEEAIGEIEAVYQVRNEERLDGKQRPAEILVDTRNNKYVLSKPEDATMSFEDRRLIVDILIIIVLSFLLSSLASLIKLPPVLGFITAGVIAGPSGVNIITDLIQIETLGEIGVFFAVLDVGLEFEMNRVMNYWQIIFLAFPMVFLLIFCSFGLLSSVIGKSVLQMGLVSFCFALSTNHFTPKLSSNGSSPQDEHFKMYLAGQDVYLGFALAILPYLKERNLDVYLGVILLKTVLLCLLIYGAVRLLVTSFNAAEKVFSRFSVKQLLTNNQSAILIFILFLVVLLAEFLEVSTDLACIFLGAVLHHFGSFHLSQDNLSVLKYVFTSLFYATIGFHLFPTFVYYELGVVISLTAVVLTVKFCFLLLVFSKFMTKYPISQKVVATICSCNVGELSLIVGSRARLYDLLSKEIYLLVISISTVSLSLIPVWSALLARKSKAAMAFVAPL